MYVPPAFREDDIAKLHALMRQHSFATLVTHEEAGPFASHLPLLIGGSNGPCGTLRGHMARANPQWRHFRDSGEVLAIFTGPHAYVSPSWYETELSVPTWNYAAVHAHGTPRLIEDLDAVLALLRETVAVYEGGFETPWPFALPEEFTRRLIQGIVAFEIEITRLEGKLKLNQNRPESDRTGVIAALSRSGRPDDLAVAALMRSVGE